MATAPSRRIAGRKRQRAPARSSPDSRKKKPAAASSASAEPAAAAAGPPVAARKRTGRQIMKATTTTGPCDCKTPPAEAAAPPVVPEPAPCVAVRRARAAGRGPARPAKADLPGEPPVSPAVDAGGGGVPSSVLEKVAAIIRAAGGGSEEAWVRAHFEHTWRPSTAAHCRVSVTKVTRIAFGNSEIQGRFEVYAAGLDAGPYDIGNLSPRQVRSGNQLALLWHGTTFCDAICREGFRQCMSKHGGGMWFATQARTSVGYAQSGEMLLSLVAVGASGRGPGFSDFSGDVVVVYDDHAVIPMFKVTFSAKY